MSLRQGLGQRLLQVTVALALATTVGDGRAAGAEPPAAPPVDTPTVGASLDRTDMFVGDQLTLTVSCVADAAIARTARLKEPLALGQFEPLESSHSDLDLGDDKLRRRFVLRVTAFATGELELPAIPIVYVDSAGQRRQASSQPIAVRVRALLAGNTQALPQPMRPPRDVLVEDRSLMRELQWMGGSIAAGFAIALFTRGWWRRRQRKRAVLPGPGPGLRPPSMIARERLRALRARGDFARERYRPFYFELAEIVRAYLGARFTFDSLERTTTELIAELVRLGLPARDLAIYGRIVAFLETSDLVKFASAPVDDSQALGALDEAEALVAHLGDTEHPDQEQELNTIAAETRRA